MELKDIQGLTDEQISQIEKLVQSETDRVRTDYSAKLKAVNDELSMFKPKEKSESEKALEDRIAALEEREKDIASKERAMTIASKLKEKNIPEGLAQYLNLGEDIDAGVEGVGTALGDYFLQNGDIPAGHNTHQGVTKADFKRMSYSERAKLFQENRQLYQALCN